MIKVFGGNTCKKIAQQLNVTLQNCLVFSICSDERLSTSLDQYLQNIEKKNIPSSLIIIGDFPSLRPAPSESPASYEAIRMIQKSAELKGTIRVCWLDGELVRSSNSLPVMHWNNFNFEQVPCGENRAATLTNASESLNHDNKKAYEHLCNLLKFNIYIGVEEEKIISIDLTDNQAYQRGLGIGLSIGQQKNVWAALLELKSLKKIRASFNDLSFIPNLTILHQLEELDIRGNPDIDLTELSSALSLKKLNISACNLDSIPNEVETLENLTTLLAYKNTIEDISNIKFSRYLKRLSLYRNQIENADINLGHCHSLKEINLGANPILHMNLKISPKINKLKLRARHIGNSILDSFHGDTVIVTSKE
ncbi:leucine-rich repeat domain-containing protein [Pelagibaculum spongiae]|uniref:Leucine-rich repeat domain-containing protein n=1 Tax=Pelagibaculum spongiae TaxID=2080658 RepID=A0A2V1GT26_9GAMM|nr:leucine-rich repeat domain-containing protein [Pelagibaculum spongiae]PVZ64513.1 hypothetical protein DC094_19565 [Pelagibaculum spongiae]